MSWLTTMTAALTTAVQLHTTVENFDRFRLYRVDYEGSHCISVK